MNLYKFKGNLGLNWMLSRHILLLVIKFKIWIPNTDLEAYVRKKKKKNAKSVAQKNVITLKMFLNISICRICLDLTLQNELGISVIHVS